MHRNILWTGREYYSLENCNIDLQSDATEVTSTIVGHYNLQIYKVNYWLRADADWRTRSLFIEARINDTIRAIRLESDGNGIWTLNGKMVNEYDGCFDVDIPLTPFTNTLPIRRLKIENGKSEEIGVVYCDLLEGTVKTVKQKYTCLSPTQFHYENIPNDFEAIIDVDEEGFVVDYPRLFVSTAKR